MKLFFRKLGEKGSPIVILHGIFGTSDNWVGIAKVLSENHQVFLLDLRNHGHSPWSEEFDYQVMSEDLMEFIQDHSLEKPLLIGHSMGGKVVMQFDLNHPNTAHKIVIVDIAPKFYPVHHSLILEGLNSLDVANLENRQAANEHMKRFEDNEGVRQFLLKNLHRTGENGFEWKINLQVITKNIDVVGLELWVHQPSETPAIFIKGAESHYIQPEDQRLISEIFPNFELFEIPQASHWVQADQPVAFLEVINSIL